MQLDSPRGLTRVLDAVYQVEAPREVWLNGVLQAVHRGLPRGVSISGVLYDLSGAAGDLVVEDILGIDIPPDWMKVGFASHRDPRLIPAIVAGYRSTLCTTFGELANTQEKAVETVRRDYHRPNRMQGQTMINGLDPSGKGCCLYLFSLAEPTLPPDRRSVYDRIATHIATGYRLQRRLAPEAATGARPGGAIDAVLAPSGDLKHAEGAARDADLREALIRAVRAREETRGASVEPAQLLSGRKGMVEARWTLVDQYEENGRRYVLARENAPGGKRAGRLSTREQQVAALAALGRSDKLIAYELGVAHSTVRVLMGRVRAKLAVSSRTELVARLRRPP
jgi:DNA-binding CsgD family transcriptional regulator